MALYPKGEKSDAVRVFIEKNGDIPAPQIKKALKKQGVIVSLPQIYNVKKQIVPHGEFPERGLVKFEELQRVWELSQTLSGGFTKLKQIVDVMARFRK